MSTDYSILLEQYPEVVSKDQMYKICHISKRKATWLLENGVIPCQDSGKKNKTLSNSDNRYREIFGQAGQQPPRSFNSCWDF